MNHPLLLGHAPASTAAAPTSAVPLAHGWREHMHAFVHQTWQHLCTDERTRYLARATDLVDLERRARAWESSPGHTNFHLL